MHLISRRSYSFEPWRTVRYFGLAMAGAETLISEAPKGHKKGDAVASPCKVVEVEERIVCCTAASRRKFSTSAAPKIDNTAGRGAPCERAIF